MKTFISASILALISLSAIANSPYISKVYDFRPAPGQFLNQIPEIEPEATTEEILSIVLEEIGHEKNPGMISLGAFGGYVVFGFDHPIVNVPGEYDFKIYGNAVDSNEAKTSGSAEPGIVLVSVDANHNGLPDDPWFELAGSDYTKPSTLKKYKVTYYKPTAGKTPISDPDDDAIIDKEYIRWSDSTGQEGFIAKNFFHAQSYWPEWIDEETLVFEGTRLENNSINTSTTPGSSNYVLLSLDWGYADNQSNNNPDYKGFNIEHAVDQDGNPVKLSQIDFVKVHTGILHCNGWLGENSTEVCGAEDLHPDAKSTGGIETSFVEESNSDMPVYDLWGRPVHVLQPGAVYIRNGEKFVPRR